ncbi:hypothetical protein ACT1UH_02930 [Mycoplasma sp. 332]|uniref:hypothetical protein n=1 Tax=Mycoplasma sp. 332 TaxID=3458236 RepID=UPI0040354E1F
MEINISKLGLNIEYFKNKYWYSKTIEIPQFIKNIEPNITEEEFFNKLLLNVFETCDLFINQKMSEFMKVSLTVDELENLLGIKRINNFISAIYTEIKYRLATEKFPEFSQRDKLITSNFTLATIGREYNNLQSLLCPESIAYLSDPSWNDLKVDESNNIDLIPIIESLNGGLDEVKKTANNNKEEIKNLDTRIKLELGNIAYWNNKTQGTISEHSNNISSINEKISDLDNNFYKKNIVDEKLKEVKTFVEQNSSKINDLEPKISNYKRKLDQIDLALQSNTLADSELLKKFNNMNESFANEYANVATQIANAIKVNLQQSNDISLINEKISDLDNNFYKKNIVDAKLEEEKKIINNNKEEIKNLDTRIKLELGNIAYWNNKTQGTISEHSNNISSINEKISDLDNNFYKKNIVDEKLKEVKTFVEQNSSKINDLESNNNNFTDNLKKLSNYINGDFQDYIKNTVLTLFKQTVKPIVDDLQNLNKSVYLKHEIDNKLESLTKLNNSNSGFSSDQREIFNKLLEKIKIRHNLSSNQYVELYHSEVGKTVNYDGQSYILLYKNTTWRDTSLSCAREHFCKPSVFDVILLQIN